MIEINHVNKWYGPTFQALKDCTTRVAKGEVVVVCGPSGSGKSTLIKCVNALEPFQEGEIILDGIKVNDPRTDLPKLRARVGMKAPSVAPNTAIQAFAETAGAAAAAGARSARWVDAALRVGWSAVIGVSSCLQRQDAWGLVFR